MISPGAGPAVVTAQLSSESVFALIEYLRHLPLSTFGSKGELLRLELVTTLRSIAGGADVVQNQRHEQLYDHLIQLFITKTTDVLALYVHPGEDDESMPSLPPEVVSYLSGTGLQLLTAIKNLSFSIHTFDSEPPLGNLLMQLVLAMVHHTIQAGSQLHGVIAASLAVLRNIVRFRGLAEHVARSSSLKSILDSTAAQREWLPTYTSVVEILTEAARCLGHYNHGVEASDTRRDASTSDASGLINTVVESVARLPAALAITRLDMLCRVLSVLPEPGTCTVYLSRFQELRGPELLVSTIRQVSDLENSEDGLPAVFECLDTLGSIVMKTTVTAGQQGDGGQKYWLRTPRTGRYEYQAMAVDVFLQVVESTKVRQIAERTLDILGQLFPARPLYGTSHARAIFSTLCLRFCDIGPTFQTLAVDFIHQVLLVEPTEWFAHEFTQLSGLLAQCDAHGAVEMAACFRNLSIHPAYVDAMRAPTVLRDLVDVVAKFTNATSPSGMELEHEETLVDNILTVLEALVAASDEARDCMCYYGMTTFLAALHCRTPMRERVAEFLLIVTADVQLPRRYISGLAAVMCDVNEDDDTGPAATVKRKGVPQQLRESDVMDADIKRRYWGISAHDIEVPVSDASSRRSMGDIPSRPSEEPTADTVMCCIRLLCATFARNKQARSLFFDAIGVGPLLGLLVHYGKRVHRDTAPDDVNIRCFVGAIMCYAWLTASPHVFDVEVEPLHDACRKAGIAAAGKAAASIVTIALTCALGMTDVPSFLAERCDVDPVGCGTACAAVQALLGNGLPLAPARSGQAVGANDYAVWHLQHPAVVPTVLEMLTADLSEHAPMSEAALLAETMDIVNELLSSESNCIAACDAGLLTAVLDVFRTTLIDPLATLHDRAVKLAKTLGTQKMTGREVRQFFSLMNVRGSVAALLKPLQHILDHSDARPAQYAHFSTKPSEDDAADAYRAAMQFAFDAGLWPPASGFTLSFWFQFSEGALLDAQDGGNGASKDTVTLCSFYGSDNAHAGSGFAVILNLRTNLLTVELAMTAGKGALAGNTVFTRCDFTTHQFQPGQWHHVTLTHEKKKTTRLLFGKSESELRLYANGICRQTQLTRSFGNSQPSRLHCLLGGTHGKVHVDWDLGGLYVLRCCITAAEAFVLHALGPNSKGFRYCYNHAILASSLSSQIVQDLHRNDGARTVFDLVSSDISIAHLSKMLVCFFRPNDGALFCQATSGGNTVTESARVKAAAPSVASRESSLPASAPQRDTRDNIESLQQRAPAFVSQHHRRGSGAALARVKSARFGQEVELCDRRGLRETLFELGGMSILLYRLATLCPLESEQVAFLKFIFSMVRGSPENARSLHAREGYVMLENFLSSDRCVVGKRLISVVLHAAFDDGIGSTDTIELSPSAVVVNIHVLKHILLSPAFLRRCHRDDAADLYSAMASVLDPSQNSSAEYNARQFRSIESVEKLLIVFENETDKFPGRVVQSIVRIIHFTMTSAPRAPREVASDIGDLMSYLISSHKYRSFRARQTQVYASLPSQGGSSHSLLRSRGGTPDLSATSEESGFSSGRGPDTGKPAAAAPAPLDRMDGHRAVARKALFKAEGLDLREVIRTPSPDLPDGTPAEVVDGFIPSPAYPAAPGFGSSKTTKRSSREVFSQFLQMHPARLTHPRKMRPPAVDWLSVSQEVKPPRDDLPSWSISSFNKWWSATGSASTTDVSVRIGLLRLLVDQVFACQLDVAPIVDVESLLALCDHTAEPVRVMVVHLIDYLLRQRGSFCTQFLNANGFRILVNQLQQHPVSPDMFVAVCNMCTGQYLSSAKNTIPKVDLPPVISQTGEVLYWALPVDPKDRDRDVEKGHTECLPVLFSLLIAAVESPNLCINIFYTVHSIFILRHDFRNAMIAHDIVQTICDVVAAAEALRNSEFAAAGGGPFTSTLADESDASPAATDAGVDMDLETTYSDQHLDLLLQHAEAFLMDITSHVCRQIATTKVDPIVANAIEDLMDYLSNWGLSVMAVQRLQRTVLQTALNELFTSFDSGGQFWKLWSLSSRQKHETVHPAQRVCYLAIDAIVLFDWIGIDGRDSPAIAPLTPHSEAAVADYESFVCATFNAIKILIVHDTIMTSEVVGETSRLRDQFGRFLIYLLDSARSRTVLAFVVGQLANNEKLYHILTGKTQLCRQLLRQMVALFETVRSTDDAADTALRGDLIQGILIFLDLKGVRPFLDHEASCLEQNPTKFRVVLATPRAAEPHHPWSYYYDRNRLHEIEARGGQKRLKTQAAKESRVKVGVSAVDVTSSVIALQDKHKKRALIEMQATLQTSSRMQKRWRTLSTEVCQPMAIWDAEQAKSVWALDPSEGPLRMRKRLVLTPMDRDMSTVSRSPVKPVLLEGAAAGAAQAAAGAPDGGEHRGGSTRPEGTVEDAAAADGGSGNEPEDVMNAQFATWYEALRNAFGELVSGRGRHQALTTLPPYDQFTLSCRLVDDKTNGLLNPVLGELDLPTFDQVLTLWQVGMFKKTLPSDGTECSPDPIGYLTGSLSATMEDVGGGLLPGDNLTDVSPCNLVTPFAVKPGELLLGNEAFYFKDDPSKQSKSHMHAPALVSLASISSDPGQLPCWRLATVREVHERRYLLQQTALEIFLVDGTTLFLNFSSRRARDDIKAQILSRGRDLLSYVDYSNTVNGSLSRDSITAQWSKGAMSNFEYLMHVNKLAGRSFNDLTQYPVMPFILKDYESEELDLSNPDVYRDLRKPMGAQDEGRLQKFLKRYNDLIELGEVPYHYGSHYSSVGSVLHLLVRLEPFTQLFLELQGGRLDFADRTFHDIGKTWELSSCVSSSDVKELVPELFFLPECLLNLNDCPFGLKQDGVAVDDVVLPPWAKGSARRFIQLHRQALESEYVSKNLNHWIDLVFGAKQDGEAAHAAHNCFLPASYEGAVDIEAIEDPVEREAQWAIVRSFGQTPKKLLFRPHVQRQFKPPVLLHSTAGEPPVLSFARVVPSSVHSFCARGDTVIGMGKNEVVMPGSACYAAWGSWDGSLRFCAVDSEREIANVRELHDDDPVTVTTCGGSTERDLVIVGARTGLVSVLQADMRNKGTPVSSPNYLLGHVSTVTALAVSDKYSVLVSGDEEGSVFVWDLNRFARVRALPKHETGITSIAISNSTADIVTVRHCDNDPHVQSRLLLWSINGMAVATAGTAERITAVCMSSLRDGAVDNMVATGMSDGSVRLWAALDLAPLVCLADPDHCAAITAMHLSDDCTALMLGNDASTVLCWLKVSSKQERKPRFGGMLQSLASSVRNREGGVAL